MGFLAGAESGYTQRASHRILGKVQRWSGILLRNCTQLARIRLPPLLHMHKNSAFGSSPRLHILLVSNCGRAPKSPAQSPHPPPTQQQNPAPSSAIPLKLTCRP